MEAVLTIVFCIIVAVFGAWDTARHRHQLGTQHKRRRTDHG